MAEFVMRLAERTIAVSSLHERVRTMCRDYLVDGAGEADETVEAASALAPDLHVTVRQDDIERERAYEDGIASGDAANGGASSTQQFSDAYLETLAVLRKIAGWLPSQDRLLAHGAVVGFEGKAYLFTAPSGTGKSTHVALWRDFLGEAVTVVNGDKPFFALPAEDGAAPIAYGTPWAGKECWQTNTSLPLAGVCVLAQGTANSMRRLDASEALDLLFRQIYMPFDAAEETAVATLGLFDRLLTRVPVFRMECDMSENAVRASFEALTGLAYDDYALSVQVRREKTGEYLMHLTACALYERKPRRKPACVSWDAVYKLAERNAVEGISWLGVQARTGVAAYGRLGEQLLPDKLAERWSSDANKTVYRRLHFDIEREAVLTEMEKVGLAYLPLKGILIADYYPRPEMRSMADNDILYGFAEPVPGGQAGFRIQGATEQEREKSVKRASRVMAGIMKARGYKVVSLGVGSHDTFHKEPLYNFEMHRKLMSDAYSYYQNPWVRAVQDENAPMQFRFSDEDEYVYMIAHAFKHYDVSGCGIRCVVDQRVFLDRKGDGLDWGYVHGELEQLGMAQFEANLRKLGHAVFDKGASMDAQDKRLLNYLLGSGIYGNQQVHMQRSFSKLEQENDGKNVKLRYVLSRMFMDEKSMRENYPFFYKHKMMRPLLFLFRAGRGLFTNRDKLRNEVKLLRKM